jgi:hypothetical protein
MMSSMKIGDLRRSVVADFHETIGLLNPLQFYPHWPAIRLQAAMPSFLR